jgi:general secretion pathway protein D
VDAVRRLLYTAEGDYNLGNFNEANARYEEVLRIDPTNTAARRGMEKLTTAQGDYFKSAYDQTRAKMLAEVDSQWEDQIPPFLAPIEVDPSAGSTDSDLVALKNKLERIIIPNFALDQASLADAIDLLRARTLEYNTLETDLDRKAINFTLNLGPPDSAAAKKVTAVRIDLNVNNLPVSEILKQITLATSTSYSTDSYAVNITAAGSESQEVISQNYRVPPDFITSLSAGETAAFDEMPKEGLLPIRLGIKEALMKQGVSFPEGTSAYLVDSTLQVLNTPQNQDLISQIVAIHASTEPVLINVKVTMIKVEQTRLEELGFDWILNNGGFGGPSWVPGASRLNLTGGSTGNGKSLKDIALPVGASDLYPVTAGNRSGDSAILGNTLDGLISRASGSQTSNPAPGVLGLRGNLSGADYQMLMRGLGQSKGVDMMARPSVSTRSGQATNITFVREFIYPTAYEPPQLPQSTAGTRVVGSDSFFGGGGGGPSPVTPSTPTDFKKRDVGVVLEVLPVLSADKQYVNLTLSPSFSEFDGFVNYGSPINTTTQNALGVSTDTVLSENNILMPIFSDKRLSTSIDIADGATIAIGSLLQESVQNVEDQTPILGSIPIVGRLFQSKARKPISTAIIFLVNVELTNPASQSYRSR